MKTKLKSNVLLWNALIFTAKAAPSYQLPQQTTCIYQWASMSPPGRKYILKMVKARSKITSQTLLIWFTGWTKCRHRRTKGFDINKIKSALETGWCADDLAIPKEQSSQLAGKHTHACLNQATLCQYRHNTTATPFSHSLCNLNQQEPFRVFSRTFLPWRDHRQFSLRQRCCLSVFNPQAINATVIPCWHESVATNLHQQ